MCNHARHFRRSERQSSQRADVIAHVLLKLISMEIIKMIALFTDLGIIWLNLIFTYKTYIQMQMRFDRERLQLL